MTYTDKILSLTPFIRKGCYRYHKTLVDIEDAVQDVIFSMLRNKHRYKHLTEEELKPILYSAVKNDYISKYRKIYNYFPVSVDISECISIKDSNRTDSLCIKRELNERIDTLPLYQRLLLRMRLSGYKYEEIAATLDRPIGTIKGDINKSKKLLNTICDVT